MVNRYRIEMGTGTFGMFIHMDATTFGIFIHMDTATFGMHISMDTETFGLLIQSYRKLSLACYMQIIDSIKVFFVKHQILRGIATF